MTALADAAVSESAMNANGFPMAESSGTEVLPGTDGDDVLYSWGRDPVIDGGAGYDWLDFRNYGLLSSAHPLTIDLANGLYSGKASGAIRGIEAVRGSVHSDTIIGNSQANTLYGGKGNDTLTGGAGSDVFSFEASGNDVDTITDLNSSDVIQLQTRLLPFAEGIAIAGSGVATRLGFVEVASDAGITTLSIGTDANAGADLQIKLRGTFKPEDFWVGKNSAGATILLAFTAPLPKSPVSEVDGTRVETSFSLVDGQTEVRTLVPVIAAGRVDDPASARRGHADIVLAGAAGAATLEVALPVGAGVTASGPVALLGAAAAGQYLQAAMNLLEGNASQAGTGIAQFFARFGDQGQLTVRTLALAAGPGDGNRIHVDGLPGASRQEALLLDARALTATTLMELGGIDFSYVVGAATISGGAGAQIVHGDGQAQNISLGAGDDQIHGGAGHDVLMGGAGDDVLEGGQGNDVLQGGRSDGFSLSLAVNSQGALVQRIQANQPLLEGIGGFHASDPRMAFLEQPVGKLLLLTSLYKAVTGNLPTLTEMNAFARIDTPMLATLAFNAYAQARPAFAGQSTPAQLRMLVTDLLGSAAATPELLSQGTDYLASGGEWGAAMLYLVRDARFAVSMVDSNGDRPLTRTHQTSEEGRITGSGHDILRGGDGNDVLAGGDGNDLLDGGAGIDVAVLNAPLQNYIMRLDAILRPTVTNQLTGEVDTLQGIELIQLANQLYQFNGTAGLVAGASIALSESVVPATADQVTLVGIPGI